MIELFLPVAVVVMAHAAPSPLEMPLQFLPAYYDSRDQDAKANPILYDKYGVPPDHYPAVIPEQPDPEYYDENATYPEMYDERDCTSVSNCPSDPADPYAPLYANPELLGFGFTSDDIEPRKWKCNAEADCFGLERIPEDLSNDTEVLFLRSFNFTALRIGDLASVPPLIKLRIEYSDLETIEPGVFGSQPTLQYLEIVGNPITRIAPKSFLELADLLSLELTNNRIQNISRSMFQGLDSVADLKIMGNNITRIDDDTFREMTNLKRLNLEDNKISLITRYAFRKLSKLTTVYLNQNRLSAVPTSALREVPALITLHLSGNPLKTIEKSDFKSIDSLQDLWIDKCQLTNIGKRTFQGKQIRVLSFADNELTTVPNLGTMKQLRTITMSNNPWICDCDMIRAVKWLRRQALTSHSEDPECTKPELYRGRRAIKLTNEELCPKRPLVNASIAPIPRDSDFEDLSPDDDDLELPEGGWSSRVYDPQLLYTEVEIATRATEVLPVASQRPVPSTGSVLTNHLQTTGKISVATGAFTTVKLSTRDAKDENLSVRNAFDGSGEVDSTTVEVQKEGHQTEHPTLPKTTKAVVPPNSRYAPFGAVIAVVGSCLLVLALGALLYKVFVAKRTVEKAKEHVRQIELHQSSKDSALCARATEQSCKDQNGKASQKADKKTDQASSDHVENGDTENAKSETESREECAGDAEDDADATASDEPDHEPLSVEEDNPAEAEDEKEEPDT